MRCCFFISKICKCDADAYLSNLNHSPAKYNFYSVALISCIAIELTATFLLNKSKRIIENQLMSCVKNS